MRIGVLLCGTRVSVFKADRLASDQHTWLIFLRIVDRLRLHAALRVCSVVSWAYRAQGGRLSSIIRSFRRLFPRVLVVLLPLFEYLHIESVLADNLAEFSGRYGVVHCRNTGSIALSSEPVIDDLDGVFVGVF